jgi:hypothetical protein
MSGHVLSSDTPPDETAVILAPEIKLAILQGNQPNMLILVNNDCHLHLLLRAGYKHDSRRAEFDNDSHLLR